MPIVVVVFFFSCRCCSCCSPNPFHHHEHLFLKTKSERNNITSKQNPQPQPILTNNFFFFTMKSAIAVLTVVAATISSVSAFACIFSPPGTQNWAGYCVPNDEERNGGWLTQYCSGGNPCKQEGTSCQVDKWDYYGVKLATCS